MLKEEPSSADVIELGGGGLEPYAKRKLEEDFVKAIENNNNDDDDGDEEVSYFRSSLVETHTDTSDTLSCFAITFLTRPRPPLH